MEYNKTYARQMRHERKLARWTDRHPNIINASLVIEALTLAYYIFMYI